MLVKFIFSKNNKIEYICRFCLIFLWWISFPRELLAFNYNNNNKSITITNLNHNIYLL